MENIIEQTSEMNHSSRKKMRKRFFRNKMTIVGLIIVTVVVLLALLAEFIVPYPDANTIAVNFKEMNKAPSALHFFGTDEIGRDVLSRTIYGARYSLMMAAVVLSIAVVIGVPLGLLAGYHGGFVNSVIMRITDIFLAIPSLILALTVAAILEPSLMNSMIAISFGWWPWFTRLTQAETLKIKNEQFIISSEGIGASATRIMFKEILPNCLPTIIVKISTDIGFVILTGASLGFLGLGAQPPTPEWGTMISEARVYLPSIWWSSVFPGLAILVTILGFSFLGDGIRDAFDVRSQ
ncbi:ABC transporter permease [Proteiniclasticum sp. SCR006]|uniref:ABC transporter permease n=1 Tax=Proteiniclasticum aestuarii TaxID=2817862 RepID=A0A939KH63_9CLOT|nr:ABC transporter permease [Proteiniclasticum aestuarii]MBO1265139.1 ABC transporter permease [Proteiniclasticum aestuarii]